MTLQLNLPARDAAPDTTLDLRPKEVKAWLAELPMAQVIQAGQQLLDRLREVNQTFAVPTVRHATLELVHPVLDRITATLQKSHHDTSFPLPAGHCLMTTLCQQLLEEMANGYKLVVIDRLLEGSTVIDIAALTQDRPDPLLLSSLWRAFNYLGAQLLESYLIYAPEPDGVWLDLHRLYHFAEQHLLHLVEIESAHQESATVATLSNAYKRILLLALCNPHHLMQGEAALLFQRLAPWSDAVKIVRVPGVPVLASAFVVDLDADAAPRYAPPSKPRTAPSQARLIDVGALLAQLDGHCQTLRTTIKEKQLRHQPVLAERREYDLFARLKHSWEQRRDRRFARTVQHSNIVMVSGLSACHHFIGNMTDFAPEGDEARLRDYAQEHGADVFAMDAADLPAAPVAAPRFAEEDAAEQDTGQRAEDVWEKVYASMPAKNARRQPTPQDSANFAINSWQQRNRSDGGLAVFCVNDCRARVRVGELVAYKHHPARLKDRWTLGVIRWLRAPDFTGVELGIMTLSDSARAVATRAVRGPGSGGEYTRSLLMAAGDRNNRDILITPTTIYDEGTELVVNLRDRLLKVKLVDLLEATGTYARFRCTDSAA